MKFEKEIRNEIQKDSYTKEDLMKEKYLVSSEGKIEIYYAPFDYINVKASIVIVGITPGWSQMEKSFKTIIKELSKNDDFSLALKKVKSESSFAGSMRNNLIKMLDDDYHYHKDEKDDDKDILDFMRDPRFEKFEDLIYENVSDDETEKEFLDI